VRGRGNAVSQCSSLAARLAEFTMEGCLDLFFAGDLAINKSSILGSDPERVSPMGESLCSALVDECGLPLPMNICGSDPPTD
jgi:hypothetical protein